MLTKLFATRPSILVIDDERTSRMIIKMSLQDRVKALFQEAEDGKTGVKMACANPPALILLDWKMPDISGIKVLEALRKKPETENIPIVMLTSKSMMGDADEAFRCGATDFLVKPIDIPQLLDKVRHYLGVTPK